MDLKISEINVLPFKNQGGFCGFASCVINNQFYVGNIAIYTSPGTQQGFRLVFPNKKLASGKVVDCFHPINKEAGEIVSSAIIKGYIELMDNFNDIS